MPTTVVLHAWWFWYACGTAVACWKVSRGRAENLSALGFQVGTRGLGSQSVGTGTHDRGPRKGRLTERDSPSREAWGLRYPIRTRWGLLHPDSSGRPVAKVPVNRERMTRNLAMARIGQGLGTVLAPTRPVQGCGRQNRGRVADSRRVALPAVGPSREPEQGRCSRDRFNEQAPGGWPNDFPAARPRGIRERMPAHPAACGAGSPRSGSRLPRSGGRKARRTIGSTGSKPCSGHPLTDRSCCWSRLHRGRGMPAADRKHPELRPGRGPVDGRDRGGGLLGHSSAGFAGCQSDYRRPDPGARRNLPVANEGESCNPTWFPRSHGPKPGPGCQWQDGGTRGMPRVRMPGLLRTSARISRV